MRHWLSALWGRICWQAWSYARRRNLARVERIPSRPEGDPTPEQRRIRANEARQAWDNRHIQDAFSAAKSYLDQQAMSCDPDDKDKAARVIVSMQLLEAVKRELARKIEDGELAEFQLAELERKRRPLRFVR